MLHRLSRFGIPLIFLLGLHYQKLISVSALVWEDLEEDPTYFYSDEYEDRGLVREYIPKNGTKYIEIPENEAVVVELYAPWCPHCQLYREHYIAMAGEVDRRSYGLRKISFYGMSCTSFHDLCKHYNISGYPTILGFKAGFKDGSDKPIELNGEDKPELTADTVGMFLEIQMAQEEPEYFSTSSYSNSQDQREKEERDYYAAMGAAAIAREKSEQFKSYQDVYLDAARSFAFSLKQGIYMAEGPLADDRRKALEEWIDLLHWTLPDEFGLHGFVSDLRENRGNIFLGADKLKEVVNRHQKANEWDIALDEEVLFFQKRLPNATAAADEKWSHVCSHGKRGAGYTCGLWELFHIMSIGVAERYETATKSHSHNIDISLHHAAETLRNFVGNFFGCQVCRTNFVKFYDGCGNNHCNRLKKGAPTPKNAKELALWVWETHNAVNKRLMGERARRSGRVIDPYEEDSAFWPTVKMCAKCWNDDGTWNKDIVYAFLKKTYWPGDVETAKFDFESDDQYFSTFMLLVNLIWLVPTGIVAAAFVKQSVSRQRLASTGRHKKIDDSLFFNV